MKRVAIVGGGVAGLSLAHALRQRTGGGVELKVLERSSRPGGNVRTDEIEGYVCEWASNGFLDNAPETLELVRQLDLEDRVQVSDDEARRRFIYRNGRLHELPGGPLAFLTSGLLSPRGRLRVAWEPFAAPRPEGDETIHAFATRRIGREAADVMIDSMVSGVFGGDARKLSLRACFPRMWQMETDHGGLFKALFARMREGRRRKGEAIGSPVGRLTSFRNGTEELIRGLCRSLGEIVETRAEALRLSPAGAGFSIELAGRAPLVADAVALAGGPGESARIVESLLPEMAATLREIPSAPMVVVCLGFEESRLDSPLNGFGYLVPRCEGRRILGVLWDSSIYPGRAPQGRALIRVMLGGAHDPGAIDLEDEALLSLVRRELAGTMGLELAPCFVHVFRHRVGIPQYTVGHLERLARLDALLEGQPGLYLAGNGFRGVAMNACIAEAGPLSERILSEIDPAPEAA